MMWRWTVLVAIICSFAPAAHAAGMKEPDNTPNVEARAFLASIQASPELQTMLDEEMRAELSARSPFTPKESTGAMATRITAWSPRRWNSPGWGKAQSMAVTCICKDMVVSVGARYDIKGSVIRSSSSEIRNSVRGSVRAIA